MKKMTLLTIIAAFCASMAACNKTTELAFTNSTNSDDKINDIVWASGDATFNSTTGIAKGATTSSKEVETTKGSVTSVSITPDNGNIIVGKATDESGNSSMVLSEGSSNTVTIKVSSAAASKDN